jgi:hypothetical protein
MKLKIAQPQKILKAELKQYFAENVYFFYIKNITKNLMISAKIPFPEYIYPEPATYPYSPEPTLSREEKQRILENTEVYAIDPDSGEIVIIDKP